MFDKMEDNKNINRIIIFIAIFIIVAIFSLIYGYKEIGSTKGNTNFIDLRNIQTSLVNSLDGEQHNVNMKFSVVVDKKNEQKLDKNNIESQIETIVSDLDYSKIREDGNVKYLKSNVMNNLVDEKGIIKDIYITDLQSDGVATEKEVKKRRKYNNKRQEDVFKGLFKNIK